MSAIKATTGTTAVFHKPRYVCRISRDPAIVCDLPSTFGARHRLGSSGMINFELIIMTAVTIGFAHRR